MMRIKQEKKKKDMIRIKTIMSSSTPLPQNGMKIIYKYKKKKNNLLPFHSVKYNGDNENQNSKK